jgi:hypothetical protein
MAISGYKARDVFDRYNIMSESDLANAAQALDEYHAMGTILGTIEGAERILEDAQRPK